MPEFDPNLKSAMAEIREIAERYDIGIAAALVSETHSEYLSGFPTWSAIRFTEEGITADFTKASYPDKVTQMAAIERSLHALLQLRDLSGKHFMQFEEVFKKIEEMLPPGFVQHKPFANHTPHDPDYRRKN